MTGSRWNTPSSATLRRPVSTTKSSVPFRALRLRAPEGRDEAVEHGARLVLALLERGADDRREVADILGDEEIVLHEALDAAQAAAIGIAQEGGDLAL